MRTEFRIDPIGNGDIIMNIPESWQPYLEAETTQPYFTKLREFVAA